MARFLIIGAGRQGVACGTFLLERYGNARVAYLDMSPGRLQAAKDLAPGPDRVSVHPCDIDRDQPQCERLIGACDCVVSCAPFVYNEMLTRLAIQLGKHFCDLGGNVGTVRRQLAMDPAARRAGVCVVPDCGLAPGAVNVLAELWRQRWSYRSVKILCGGLPQQPSGVLRYQANFSIHGLLNEYFDDCQVSRNGRLVTIPGLSEVESVRDLPLPGEFEAFATSGGASLAPEIYAPLGIDYEYKTIRHPGHRDAIQAMAEVGFFTECPLGDLLKESPVELAGCEALRQFAPRNLAVALLGRAFTSDRRDVVVVRIQVLGTDEQARPAEGRIELLDRSDERFTAMERTTGFSIGVVAAFLAALLPERAPVGAYAPFQVLPPVRLIQELSPAGVMIDVVP